MSHLGEGEGYQQCGRKWTGGGRGLPKNADESGQKEGGGLVVIRHPFQSSLWKRKEGM